MYKLGKNTIKNMKGVDYRLVICASQAITRVKQNFCVVDTGGLRTAKLQKKIFLAGHSKCDGRKKKSKHQLGLALDLVPWNNKADWTPSLMPSIVFEMKQIAKENDIDLICGADWTDFFDPYHFEVRNK